jgi:hypothetical protein
MSKTLDETKAAWMEEQRLEEIYYQRAMSAQQMAIEQSTAWQNQRNSACNAYRAYVEAQNG